MALWSFAVCFSCSSLIKISNRFWVVVLLCYRPSLEEIRVLEGKLSHQIRSNVNLAVLTDLVSLQFGGPPLSESGTAWYTFSDLVQKRENNPSLSLTSWQKRERKTHADFQCWVGEGVSGRIVRVSSWALDLRLVQCPQRRHWTGKLWAWTLNCLPGFKKESLDFCCCC